MMNKKIYGVFGAVMLTSICGALGMIQDTTKVLSDFGKQEFKNFSMLQTLLQKEDYNDAEYKKIFESMKKTTQKTLSGETISASKFKASCLCFKNPGYSVYQEYVSDMYHKGKKHRFQIMDFGKQEITEFKSDIFFYRPSHISKGNHVLVWGGNCDKSAWINIYNLKNTEYKEVYLGPELFGRDYLLRLDHLSLLPGSDRYLLCCVFYAEDYLFHRRGFITIDLEKTIEEHRTIVADTAWFPEEADYDCFKVLYEPKKKLVAWCGHKVVQVVRYNPKDGALTTLKSCKIEGDTFQYTFANGGLCLKPITFYKEEESSEKNKKE